MFSKTCEYGIRAAIFIAFQSYQDNRIGLKEIAKKIDSPEAFTAKILQILSRDNIIKSIKGGFLVNVSLSVDNSSIFPKKIKENIATECKLTGLMIASHLTEPVCKVREYYYSLYILDETCKTTAEKHIQAI